jgi:hypothetical protein
MALQHELTLSFSIRDEVGREVGLGSHAQDGVFVPGLLHALRSEILQRDWTVVHGGTRVELVGISVATADGRASFTPSELEDIDP